MLVVGDIIERLANSGGSAERRMTSAVVEEVFNCVAEMGRVSL